AGSLTVVSQNVTTPINAGDSLPFDFTTKVDMTVSTSDSIFNFITWIELTGDPIQLDDTLNGQATSQSSLPLPIVTISPFSYGDSVSLSAISPDAIYWYDSDTANVEIATGPAYKTPPLFDTTTYYVKASNYIPTQTAYVGTATTTNDVYTMPCPYGGDFGGSKQQYLILASELAAMGITAAPIESISFDLASAFTATHNGYEIKIGHTTTTSLSTTFITGLTTYYLGSHTEVAGWNTHTLSTPFLWDGNSNIVIELKLPVSGFGSNPPARYTTTTFNASTNAMGFMSQTATTGFVSPKRPNMRLITQGTLGCSSLKTPVVINIIPPAKDARVATIIEPVSGCGLGLTDVKVDILNNGTDTINGGLSATYRIGNGAYITPEVINTVINPGDTLVYTFNTQAALTAPLAGTDYIITSKAILLGDSYSANDSTISDTIHSVYTPVNPTISGTTINYGQQAVFSTVSNDTMYWYDDSIAGNLVHTGNHFITPPLYDTTNYFVQAQHTIGATDYLTGPGSGANTSTQYPSPYGSTQYGARSQFIYRASELHAIGMVKGEIDALSFKVSVVVGASYDGYEIKIGNTSQNTLTAFETNLTTVYSVSSYSEVNGWNLHNFQMPFYWDGVSNIVVETCFKNNSNGSNAGVFNDNTSYISSIVSWGTNTFNCSSTNINGSYYVRPQIKFRATGYGDCISDRIAVTANVIGFPAVDAGLIEVINPNISAANGVSTPVKVALKNFGTNTLTSSTINWSIDGVTQAPAYSWTGSLITADIDTVTIASPSFGGGNHDIKAWVSNPNLVADTININDTTTTNFDVCMSGTYTIGTNGDYQSFTDAVNIMVQAGVCGNVIFNVDSGLYVEKLVIPQISGLGPNATVTFQSATGDSTDVKIVQSTTQYSNYIVKIADADYITFRKISVSANGLDYGNCFVLTGNATHITIENCKITSTLASQYNSTASAVYSTSENVGNIHVLNNEITNGYHGVYFSGTNTNRQYGNVIDGNNISDFYNYATYLRYQDSVQMLNNIIETHSVYSYHYGTYFYYNTGQWVIAGNDIRLYASVNSNGIYVYNSEGSASSRAKIYNNFIGDHNGTGGNVGIYIYDGDYIDCHYNSINITTGSNASKGLYVNTGSNLRFKNNIFAVDDGDAIYVTGQGTVAITEFDYNNLYVGPNSTKFAFWSAAISDFAMLKLMDVNKNVHSLNINPNYYSQTNLHTDEALLNAAGTPIAGITVDFDGDTRNATTPDIGADEFTPAPIDLAAYEIVYPVLSDCGYAVSDSIVVSVKNNGTDTIDFSVTNAQIVVMSIGANPDTITYNLTSGVIYPSTLQNFVVTNTFDLSINSKYILDAYTVITNDGNSLNDAAQQVEFLSYPTIDNFPYTEDFESGYNLTFKENTSTHSNIQVTGTAAHNGLNGLLFSGGDGGLSNYGYVTGAFANTNQVAKAVTCDIDATNVPALTMKFDLKQMHSSTTPLYSWFRVLINDSTGTHYLKNTVGDSTFNPISPYNDTAKTQIFNLNAWAGQVFSISLEAALRADYSTSQSDYAMVDDFVIWVPSTKDAALTAFVQPAIPIISANNLVTVEVRVENFGTDTLQSIPVGYIVNNGTPVLETINTTLAPNAITTHVFSTQFNAAIGNYDLCAFVNVTGDITATNDTTCVSFSGLKTYNINYCDDFEGSVDWAANGDKDQWELGMPSMTTINTAHSGTKVWATRLNSDYQTDAVEYLYSPIVIIPNNPNDTAVLEFWHWMEVQANHAYGNIQYSLNGGSTWVNLGYINSGVNWYNANISGYHCWSMSTSGWSFSSIKLNPSLFNTGLPVQFRFTFTADLFVNNNNGWAIDDFCVTIPQVPFDAGVISINQPSGTTITGDTVTVDVTIENFGGDTLYSIPVSYVTPLGTISETVTDTLLPDSTMNYVFMTKYISPSNNYKLCSYTSLGGDVIHTNDTSCSNIMTGPALIDAGIIAIVSPSGQTTIGGQYSVTATIKNFGTNTLSSIPVLYSLSGNVQAQETFNGTLLSDSTVDYTFTGKYNSPVGNYTICAKTDLVNDPNIANDSICENIIGTGVNELNENGFEVWQNVPNPATGLTTIKYFVHQQGEVRFRLINSFGQEIRYETKKVNSGQHTIEFNTNEIAEGIYYYTLEFNMERKSMRMLIIR
ncbi:T9SS type A sorting domain-containing protein, partial [Bacteroidota bacterium]